MTATKTKGFADYRQPCLAEPFAKIAAKCFLRIARGAFGPTSFSSSICHHGLNTAPRADAVNEVAETYPVARGHYLN